MEGPDKKSKQKSCKIKNDGSRSKGGEAGNDGRFLSRLFERLSGFSDFHTDILFFLYIGVKKLFSDEKMFSIFLLHIEKVFCLVT